VSHTTPPLSVRWVPRNIRTIQELLGHSSVKATMIYTHFLNRDPLGVRSPLDRL